MIQFMEKTRADRLEAFKRSTRIARVKLVTTVVQSIIPPSQREDPTVAEALLCIDRIRDVIMDTPPDHILTKDDFDWLSEALEEHMEERLCASRQYFADKFFKKLQLDASMTSEDMMSLAIAAWFRCQDCNKCFTFPDVLDHVCDFREDPPPREVDDEWANIVNTALEYLPRLWIAHRFSGGFALLRSIITAYGMDPNTATVEDMDNAHVRLICRTSKCQTRRREPCSTSTRIVMDWRTAVRIFARSLTRAPLTDL